MTVFVLGGGPAGMALVDGLVDAGHGNIVLIERMDSLGGLAQTVDWVGHGRHDLGPHKIFTLDSDLMARVRGLLPPDAWLTRSKLSRIYIGGQYLPYPPSPLSLASVFGFRKFAAMVASYLAAKISGLARKPGGPLTFETDLQRRVGRVLYENIFRPIAIKLWGNPGELDEKLSRGRVQTPSLGELLKRTLGLSKSSAFEALTFDYPRGGLQTIWNAVERKSAGKAEFLKRHEVLGLKQVDGLITSIVLRSMDGPAATREIEVKRGDLVISTMPLKPTARLLQLVPERAMAKLDEVIELNDLILVFFHCAMPSLMDESWIFVPDPEIIFHRVSEQESFDPSMTPDGTIVCCEIMNSGVRPTGENSDAEIAALAREGLERMGYLTGALRGERVIRLKSAYPVFKSGFEPILNDVLQSLDGLANFRTIGRQGSFNYIGTLDAMDIGYGAARWITQGHHGELWTQERLRTSHYPVLD